MLSYLFCLAFIFTLSSVRAAQDFKEVDACPKNESTWSTQAGKKNCGGVTPDYMCAAIENQLGKFGEICTKHGLTPTGKCAVLNAQTYNLDSVDCKADNGCPTESYLPKVLWKYPICYGNFYGKKTTPAPGTIATITNAGLGNNTQGDGSKSGGSGAGVVGVVVAVVIVVVVVILVVFYVRNQFGVKDKVQKHIADCRQTLQHRNEPRNKDIENGDPDSNVAFLNEDIENGDPDSNVAFLNEDKKKKGASSEQPAKSEKAKTKEEPPVYAVSVKAKTKKEKAAKTRDDEINEVNLANYEENAMRIEKLKELLKYLAHILERELNVIDLKEKTVIHSNSIRAHFSEQILKELQNVKNADGYSQLDIGLVFTLLWNFCGNIKPPNKGWGYEPTDDETNVGADIERIRLMWNKFCDDDLQFKHLDDVYNRMKQKYGTVAVHGDDGVIRSPLEEREKAEGFEMMKLKIESYKLNENCRVEEGIVITDNITTALRILQSKNVVILKGVIGCGKTHALRAVQNHYKGAEWETEWVEFQNIKGDFSKDKPTILLCDNLFGRFGSCVFSQDAVNETEKVLKAIESSSKENIKIVIGIHTHVYDEVKKTLKLSFLHLKNITVEMDNFSDAETLLIFKEQLKKGHCKKDANCWFKSVGFESVLDKLSKNQGHIGGPFLSLMYCNCHELFSDDAFSTSPVQTLMQHFQRMRDDKPTLYHCLVYLMCVEEHNCDEEPKEWAKMVSEDVKKAALENINTSSGYIHVDANKATLAHEVLTMVLFKSTAKVEEILTGVVKNCSDDLIIQVFRPANDIHSQCEFYCEFKDSGKKSPFYSVSKELVNQSHCKYDWKAEKHPLMTNASFKKSYKKNFVKSPKDKN